MKHPVLLFLCITNTALFSQNLQLHYDFRHTVDPAHAAKNFPTLYVEYFKQQDSGTAFIKPGSFLFKMQNDLSGNSANPGKFYMQVSQTFRCWRPKVFLSLQYSGGMGITEPKQYSYYITNSPSLGVCYPFQWKGAYFSTILSYTITLFKKPSHDLLYSFYWGKGFLNYKLEFAGDIECYTQNKNTGESDTGNLHGKRFSFLAEPQLWFNCYKSFALGTRVNFYYHILTTNSILQAYPTLAIKYKF